MEDLRGLNAGTLSYFFDLFLPKCGPFANSIFDLLLIFHSDVASPFTSGIAALATALSSGVRGNIATAITVAVAVEGNSSGRMDASTGITVIVVVITVVVVVGCALWYLNCFKGIRLGMERNYISGRRQKLLLHLFLLLLFFSINNHPIFKESLFLGRRKERKRSCFGENLSEWQVSSSSLGEEKRNNVFCFQLELATRSLDH